MNKNLIYACLYGETEIVSDILNSNRVEIDFFYDKLKGTPLILACKNGYLDIVNLLVENGANINKVSKENINGEEYEYTPIMYATENGYTDIVKYLIYKGAKHLSSVLYIASVGNEIDIINILIKDNYILENLNKYTYKNSLVKSLIKGHFEIAKALIEKDTNINNYYKNEINLYDIAFKIDNKEILNLLNTKGFSINLEN